ncbi:MAG: TlpA family protein disulfide reductase [Planctomycetaceae bacterium]|nr:TlpA family protein disulfide reductase [Planctomycetaceae bacterium]
MYIERLNRLVTVSLVLLASMLPLQAAQGPSDALLASLPENCIAILRVNNLNDALTKMDSYLMGASPVPVSLAMLVNMQLVSATGDATLTGIDKAGSFVVMVLPSEEEDVNVGILAPLTSFDEFTAANKSVSKLEDGTVLLNAPQSQIGSFVLASVLNGKYALAVPESEKESLSPLKTALDDKTSKRLAARLSAAQSKDASTVPAWAFVNLSMLYDEHGEEIQEAIDEGMQKAGEQGMGELMGVAGKMYKEMFKTFAGDADSLTIAMQPENTLLTIDTTLRAKDGSETAKMLVADPAAKNGYQLGGFMNNTYAINALAKLNQPMLEKMNETMLRIMDASATEGTSAELSAKLRTLMNEWMKGTGSEFGFSFSYAAGAPPIRLREVVQMKEGTSAKKMMTENLDAINDIYKSMGLPFQISYKADAETYKDTGIDVIQISALEATQGAEANSEFNEMMKKMYGPEGIKYFMAQKGSLLLITIGGQGIDEMKSLIDQPASQPIAGDMKTAVDTLANTAYGDFAASINILRLMKGMGEMMQSLPGAEQNPMKDIFKGINIQSQSTLVLGGKVADGQLGLRIALPKQHLMEVVTAGMQIQQQIMQDQQQQMQQPEQAEPNQSAAQKSMPFAAAPSATAQPQQEAASLKTWVGKKAPELKMIDLDNQIHRISRLKGKKVVLDFWATWCAPCKESIPHLIALRSRTVPESAVIIGLSNEAADKVTQYVKSAKINYPIAVYNEEVPAPYAKVTGLPTLFLIDAEGTIVDVIEGYDPATTPQKIEAFLK